MPEVRLERAKLSWQRRQGPCRTALQNAERRLCDAVASRSYQSGPRRSLISESLVQRDHDVGLRPAAHDVVDRIQRLAGIACDC